MSSQPHLPSSFCPVYHQAVELIGRRWTGAILRAMLAGATPSLSDRLLSERLKELEQHGIVTRTVIPNTPVRIEYRLTEKGADLSGVVEAISAWGETWLTGDHAAGHPDCPPADAPVDHLIDAAPVAAGSHAGR
jgi:DNA-binding HxlR family transcriptional regulator